MRRLVPLALAGFVAALAIAGCGGSGDATETIGGGESVTIPSDAHGVYAELEAILAQFPYQRWYASCVVKEVERELSPAEAEKLAELPEAEREKRETAVTAKAGPACEAETKRPVVDPNAASDELDLLRASFVAPMSEEAEANGFTPPQVACVRSKFKTLPDKILIDLVNSTDKVRKVILISIFHACAEVE